MTLTQYIRRVVVATVHFAKSVVGVVSGVIGCLALVGPLAVPALEDLPLWPRVAVVAAVVVLLLAGGSYRVAKEEADARKDADEASSQSKKEAEVLQQRVSELVNRRSRSEGVTQTVSESFATHGGRIIHNDGGTPRMDVVIRRAAWQGPGSAYREGYDDEE